MQASDWLMRSQSVIKLFALLLMLSTTLTGCAANSLPSETGFVKPPLPATLTASDSRDASDYSQRVQTFSAQVSDWLERVRVYLDE